MQPQDESPDTATQETLKDDATDIFEELQGDPEQIDRSEVIGEGVRVLAQWSLRLLLIAAASFATLFLVKQFWRGLLPIILAIIVCTVLWPPTKWMRDHKVPAGLASLITILSSFGVFGAVIWVVAPDVARQSHTLYFQAIQGVQTLQLWLQGPPLNLNADDLTQQVNRAAQWIQEESGSIAGEIFSGIGVATSSLITLGIVLVLTFFFLKDGDRFLPWVRSIAGRRAGWHLTEVLTRSWTTLGGFIRAQAIVSLVDAVFIGLGLVLLGVPMALALAVLTFLAGFIPIIGAFVAGTLAVLVALVSLGLTEAIIALVIILVVQQVESNVLSPLLQSKAMNLHPVVVLVSVTIGGSLFQIMGAFLAVPVAAMIAVLLRYIQDMIALRAGEKTVAEIAFATRAGSISGHFSEQAGKLARAQRLLRIGAHMSKPQVQGPSEPDSVQRDAQAGSTAQESEDGHTSAEALVSRNEGHHETGPQEGKLRATAKKIASIFDKI